MRIDETYGQGRDTRKTVSENEKRLRETCQEFEALLLGFVFKRAFQPVFGSPLFGSREETWFREMWIDEVAKGLARQGGVGIAEMLWKQVREKESDHVEEG